MADEPIPNGAYVLFARVLSRRRLFACVIAATVAVAGGCVAAPGPARLKPADNEANNHFVRALMLNNEVTSWLNKQGKPGEISVGTLDVDDLRKQVEKLKTAVGEAQSVSPDFLARAHPQLLEMWRSAFIPAVQGKHDYYAAALANPSAPPSPAQLVEPLRLSDRFGTWYEANQQSIRDGIRAMAG